VRTLLELLDRAPALVARQLRHVAELLQRALARGVGGGVEQHQVESHFRRDQVHVRALAARQLDVGERLGLAQRDAEEQVAQHREARLGMRDVQAVVDRMAGVAGEVPVAVEGERERRRGADQHVLEILLDQRRQGPVHARPPCTSARASSANASSTPCPVLALVSNSGMVLAQFLERLRPDLPLSPRDRACSPASPRGSRRAGS
jgi:hypothetical protein